MSISSVFASLNPSERAIYPDGINVLLALLGLGGSGSVKTAALHMFGSDQGMIDYATSILELDKSPEIRSENGIFFTDDQKVISDGYYNVVSTLASLYRVDFRDPNTVEDLNAWIEERSGFKKVLNPASVANAFAVVVNTLWFKDQWVLQFQPSSTQPHPFTRLDGSKVEVQMMLQSSSKIPFYQDDTLTAVQLPLKNGAQAEFVMGLPSSSAFETDLPFQSGTKVILSLPKFSHQEVIDLTPVLEAVGFGGLFSAGGLDGMVPPTPGVRAAIDEFKQIIFTEFNEEGAEVRAVTFATTRAATLSFEERVVITFDKPFHYRIIKPFPGGYSTLVQGFYDGGK